MRVETQDNGAGNWRHNSAPRNWRARDGTPYRPLAFGLRHQRNTDQFLTVTHKHACDAAETCSILNLK